MEETVIDDIISLESSLNEDFLTLIDSGLQLATTVMHTERKTCIHEGKHTQNVWGTYTEHMENIM